MPCRIARAALAMCLGSLSGLCSSLSMPYHATAEGSGWRCNAGYYRTASPDRATCARCRALQCAAGWYATECTGTMDSVCVQCTREAGAVFGQDCRVLRCLAGYYMRYASDALAMRYASDASASSDSTDSTATCVQCPRGSFCADGITASACAGNCTTAVNGADTALMCVPAEASPSIEARAYITYFIASDAIAPQATRKWPPYVATRGCSLLKTASGSEFTCTVSMPTCVADAVFQWWVGRIDAAADAVALNVTGFRGPPRIRKAAEQAAVLRPDFVVEPRKWGQTRSQYFKTLWAMSGLVFGMFVVSCWMCMLLHLRRVASAKLKRAAPSYGNVLQVSTRVR